MTFSSLSMGDIAGLLNSLLVFVSVFGVYLQLKQVLDRKKLTNQSPTALLSLNQFTVSYFAYFSFFVYGYSITPFNHYLVWPRFVACSLLLLLLLEIMRDRKGTIERVAFSLAFSAFLIGLAGLFIGSSISDEGNLIATTIILAVSLSLAQGYWHQIHLIIKNGQTGAVNIRMSQFILLMDFSTLFLAYTIGFSNSWPLVVLATVSGVTKIIILYLFRWVKVSETASANRLAQTTR